ncbi:hypothetical protein [Thioalkalivibrio sp. ALJT]|uniref:hypothetical protein n=1 Tax=Thioalkalivibrio sp. ALJT TaxID=1158146 RepID=UPI000366C4B3|nr:hypothetical protein [Thioalkalivibrio sp. ALJT]
MARDATGRVTAAAGRVRLDEGVLRGALVCVLGGALAFLAATARGGCDLVEQDARGLQEVRVAAVQGVDVLQLRDGRSVRLPGLALAAPLPGTATVARPLRPHAGLRAALEQRLDAADGRLTLRPGWPARDAAGRLRMHAWLPDGSLLAAELIAAGAAMARPGPEPDPLDACFDAAEAAARDASRGLWLERPATLPVAALERRSPAWQPGLLRLQGEVVAVRATERHWVLELEGPLDALIRQADREHWRDFEPALEPANLVGESVILRGQVYAWRDRLRVRIRHPLDLEVVD